MSIPAKEIDGILYTADFIRNETHPLMDVRDVLLAQGQYPHAQAMNVAIELLLHLANHTL